MPAKKPLVKATPEEKVNVEKKKYAEQTHKNIKGASNRWLECHEVEVSKETFTDVNMAELMHAVWKTHPNKGQIKQLQMFFKFCREKWRYILCLE